MKTSKPAPTTQTTQSLATMPMTGYVRLSRLITFIPLSASTIWRKSRAGTFPKPYKLSENSTAWKCSEVLEWQKEMEMTQ
jgi:predicted DNA-binding transcriptional regulator AlpA